MGRAEACQKLAWRETPYSLVLSECPLILPAMLSHYDLNRTYPNGDRYKGEATEDGVKDGRGTYSWACNGATYVGQWKKNQQHGHGRYVDPTPVSGFTYDGEFVKGNRHGAGQCVFASGWQYHGDWLDGCMDGLGWLWFEAQPLGGSASSRKTATALPPPPPIVGRLALGVADGTMAPDGAAPPSLLDDANGPLSAGRDALCSYRGFFADGKRHGVGVASYEGMQAPQSAWSPSSAIAVMTPQSCYAGNWINDQWATAPRRSPPQAPPVDNGVDGAPGSAVAAVPHRRLPGLARVIAAPSPNLSSALAASSSCGSSWFYWVARDAIYVGPFGAAETARPPPSSPMTDLVGKATMVMRQQGSVYHGSIVKGLPHGGRGEEWLFDVVNARAADEGRWRPDPNRASTEAAPAAAWVRVVDAWTPLSKFKTVCDLRTAPNRVKSAEALLKDLSAAPSDHVDLVAQLQRLQDPPLIEHYAGDFRLGARSGAGVLRIRNAARVGLAGAAAGVADWDETYEGSFENSIWRGLGKWTRSVPLVPSTTRSDASDAPLRIAAGHHSLGSYRGEFSATRCRHGEGTADFLDASRYRGSWRDDMADGQGEWLECSVTMADGLRDPDGRRMLNEERRGGVGSYKGRFVQGFPHGERGVLAIMLPQTQRADASASSSASAPRSRRLVAATYEGPFARGVWDGAAPCPIFRLFVGVQDGGDSPRSPSMRDLDATLDHIRKKFALAAEYAVPFRAGLPDGAGMCRWPATGDVYRGEFARGSRHGAGRIDYGATGDHYDGEWGDDVFEGSGLYHVADSGDWYRGNWRAGKRHGVVVASVYGKYTYTGAFTENVRNGKGCCKFSNGTVYDGEWAADAYHGEGTLTMQDGTVFEGAFRGGQPHGADVAMRSANKIRYRGDVRDGQIEGHGTMHYLNGDVYEGEFRRGGERCGKGTIAFAGGAGGVLRATWNGDGVVDGVASFQPPASASGGPLATATRRRLYRAGTLVSEELDEAGGVLRCGVTDESSRALTGAASLAGTVQVAADEEAKTRVPCRVRSVVPDCAEGAKIQQKQPVLTVGSLVPSVQPVTQAGSPHHHDSHVEEAVASPSPGQRSAVLNRQIETLETAAAEEGDPKERQRLLRRLALLRATRLRDIHRVARDDLH